MGTDDVPVVVGNGKNAATNGHGQTLIFQKSFSGRGCRQGLFWPVHPQRFLIFRGNVELYVNLRIDLLETDILDALNEGIHHPDAAVILAVVEILGINGMASRFKRPMGSVFFPTESAAMRAAARALRSASTSVTGWRMACSKPCSTSSFRVIFR